MSEVLTDPDAVRAALEAGDEYTMPPVDPATGKGIAWLRAAVARFSDGPPHTRRRGYAVDLLAALDPGHLRTRAHHRTAETLASGRDPVEVMSTIARPVPVGVLASALGVRSDPTPAVAAAARSYQPHTAISGAADGAVAALVAAFGGVADEPTAARIGLLVQACDATAGLIGGAVLAECGRAVPAHTVTDEAGSERRAGSVEAALRQDPPVRHTRRVRSGREVHLDLTTLPFGAGPHRCPGREHAIAIATGVLDALRGWRVVPGPIEYELALRIPVRILVTRPV